jgi:hypothetical protein
MCNDEPFARKGGLLVYERLHPLLRQVSTTSTTRIVGSDPICAAIGISQTVYPARRPNAVLLTRPDCYPVVLAAARLLHRPFDAVMLYTGGEKLEEEVSRELIRLSPQGKGLPGQVIVIGTIHANVLHELAGIGFSVWHLVGHDLWDTVFRIADCEAAPVSDYALLVSDDPQGGGVAVGSFAASTGAPILFASESGLSDMAVRFLRKHPRKKLIAVAPEGYLPGAVAGVVKRLGSKVEAWVGGRDAFETAVSFAKLRLTKAKFGFGKKGRGNAVMALVPAERWAFGAASAALSRSGRQTPLLLTRQDRMPAPVEDFLMEWQDRSAHKSRLHGFVVGSFDVINDPVQIMLHRAIAQDGV